MPARKCIATPALERTGRYSSGTSPQTAQNCRQIYAQPTYVPITEHLYTLALGNLKAVLNPVG